MGTQVNSHLPYVQFTTLHVQVVYAELELHGNSE